MHPLTTVIFLSFSGILWYNFLKTWKGDAGVVYATEENRRHAIIELAENATTKNPFDPKVFCSTCIVRRPIRYTYRKKVRSVPGSRPHCYR